MAKRVTINSKGEAVELGVNQSFMRTLKLEMRLQELKEAENEIVKYLSAHGIETENKKFFYMVQPLYSKERILFLAKTQVASSSQIVKISNEIEKHPEILCNEEKTDFYKSVVSDNSVNRPCWYFLSAGCIEFERNLYDCKRINARFFKPVPYVQFLKMLNQALPPENFTGDETPYFRLFLNGVDITNPQNFLMFAFERDIGEQEKSLFDVTINEAVNEHKRKYRYSDKDKTSNQSAVCLSIINESKRNIYELYEQIKICIKKTCKNSYGIIYNGNKVTAHLSEDEKITLYISGTVENPQIIIGGKILNSIDAFKEVLNNKGYLEETEWFAKKVKPNIQEKAAKKKSKAQSTEKVEWKKRSK